MKRPDKKDYSIEPESPYQSGLVKEAYIMAVDKYLDYIDQNASDHDDMIEGIEKLNEGLKDPEYRQVWIANIAMAQIDCERWYREENNKAGKYLNATDRHAIANKGAEYFLELLSK